MSDKLSWGLVHILVPITLVYALTMSYAIRDGLAFAISLVGTLVIMFLIGYVNGKAR
ncbi:hypothetical protein [Bacillus infantis]|uniref:hypothetical protein n=1 Tax=Bacillus infantis TaxID=324767 RepID=UPI003CF0E623